MKRLIFALIVLSVLVGAIPAHAQTGPGYTPPPGSGGGNASPALPIYPLTDTGLLTPPAIDITPIDGVPTFYVQAFSEQRLQSPCQYSTSEMLALLVPRWPYGSQYPVQGFVTELCHQNSATSGVDPETWNVSVQPVIPGYSPRNTYPIHQWTTVELAKIDWTQNAGFWTECLTRVPQMFYQNRTLLPDVTDGSAWALGICAALATMWTRQGRLTHASGVYRMYQDEALHSAAEDAAANRPPSRKTQVNTALANIWFQITAWLSQI